MRLTPSSSGGAPTRAVIFTNGNRRVITADQTFRVGNMTFRLVAVGTQVIRLAPGAALVGGGGSRLITIQRGQTVTVVNTATGARHRIRYAEPATGSGG